MTFISTHPGGGKPKLAMTQARRQLHTKEGANILLFICEADMYIDPADVVCQTVSQLVCDNVENKDNRMTEVTE